MKKITLFLFLLSAAAQAQTNQIKHVIIIGVDGMSPDGIMHAHAPNMDTLIARGSHTFKCQAVKPTVSSPNWESIITGAEPKQHSVWGNEWKVRDVKDSVFCNGKKGHIFPTIFRVLREQKPKAKIFCFSNWWSFVRLVEPRVCNAKQRTLTMGLTGSRAATCIQVRKPDLLFMHLDRVDEYGHKYGHGSPQYYEAVGTADEIIGQVMRAVKKAGLENSTAIMIIADHGGIGHGHGGNTPQEVNVPFIICGPSIKKGYQIKGEPHNYDTTVTIAHILGINPPACWEGKVIDEIFEKVANK
jgi:predicted AlkP superfamily pyrophosphatase or phosphodiesterase